LRYGICQTGALVYKGFNLLDNPDNPLVLTVFGFLRTIPTGRSCKLLVEGVYPTHSYNITYV